MKKYIFTLLRLILLFSISYNSFGQKLPITQKGSLLVPKNTKIDGDPKEWKGLYEAYNPSTGIFYTLANDHERIYLTIHIKDFFVMQKFLGGGATLSIFSTDKKTNLKPATVRFPLISQGIAGGSVSRIKDTATKLQQKLFMINNQLSAAAKELQVSGLTAITDSLISVYNELDIKASIAFNLNRELTYELSLPLKYFKDRIDNLGSFKYNIKMEGIMRSLEITVGARQVSPSSKEGQEMLSQLSDPARQNIIGTVDGSGNITPAKGSFAELLSPTDFTATYTLARLL